jgi:receptor protein-tyrosine kinase
VQIAPKVPLIIGLTAFAAIAVGSGSSSLFEYLDDTIKSKEDFDRYVALPFLGFIPRIERRRRAHARHRRRRAAGSAIAEAFRAVRTSILFSRSDKPVRTILVTSAGPGEGKTTVATNLAITLAKHKGPVLLVDADLRRPRVAKALGSRTSVGLTNASSANATLDQVIQRTSIEGFRASRRARSRRTRGAPARRDLATLLESGLRVRPHRDRLAARDRRLRRARRRARARTASTS